MQKPINLPIHYAIFLVVWIFLSVLMYEISNPRYNDEGAYLSAVLSVLLFPFGMALFSLVRKRYFLNLAISRQVIWAAVITPIIYFFFKYSAIFFIQAFAG